MKNWSEKTIKIVVWSLTVVVLGLIVILGNPNWKVPLPEGVDLSFFACISFYDECIGCHLFGGSIDFCEEKGYKKSSACHLLCDDFLCFVPVIIRNPSCYSPAY